MATADQEARNVAILVEIAARNHVLKLQGHHSAREFARRLEQKLERNVARSRVTGRRRRDDQRAR